PAPARTETYTLSLHDALPIYGLDQAGMLLDGLAYERAFGAGYRWDETGVLPAGTVGGDAFGNVVAARWPLRRTEVVRLPGEETRSEEHTSELQSLRHLVCRLL